MGNHIEMLRFRSIPGKMKRFTTPYRAINRCVDVEQETWGKKDNENMFKE